MQKRNQLIEASNLHQKLHFGLIALLFGGIALTADVCAGQQPMHPRLSPRRWRSKSKLPRRVHQRPALRSA